MQNENLTCPVRGELNVNAKSKDALTFSEEYRRVECVRMLLKKGYKKENFCFEKNVWEIGNSGRNRLRADIVIENAGKTILVAEIKRDTKDKKSAVENQLVPALIKTDAEFGIYFDGVCNSLFVKKDGYKNEHSLNLLPKFGFDFEAVPLTFGDLRPISNINSLLEELEQILHSLGATKEEKYSQLFALILCKYYDEKCCEDSDETLAFQLGGELLQKLNELYKNAKSYYSNQNLPLNLEFKKEALERIVFVLQDYTFLNSKQDILQALFMKFASATLKTELSQFYTPVSIVEFIVSLLDIKNTHKVIDSAGGSGDFLVGVMKANRRAFENVYYWDVSKNATNVAQLNMILNGDGRSKVECIDSIAEFERQNGEFDFVITNPPFGDKTRFNGSLEILKHYELYTKYGYSQLGVLFLERNLNLLRDGGVMAIVVPHGYMTNPKDRPIREFLLDKFKILAYISLPEGAFKGSEAGVKSGVLLLKKEKTESSNYKIFVASATELGFDYTSKSLKPLYIQNELNGEYILDENNNRILKNDLPRIAENFRDFANGATGLEFCYKFDIVNEPNLVLNPHVYERGYLACVERILRGEHATLSKFEVTNASDFRAEKSEIYSYIDISNLTFGDYMRSNRLRGWALPNRAKISLKENDIILSKLKGSFGKFALIFERDTSRLVATNGTFRIRVSDERVRLSFFRFLFSSEFLTQANALATGNIMLDLKESDIKKRLVFPLLDETELEKVRQFLEAKRLAREFLDV